MGFPRARRFSRSAGRKWHHASRTNEHGRSCAGPERRAALDLPSDSLMPPHYKLRARLWLVFICGALCGAHFLFFRFSFHELNPFDLTRGLFFASALWSCALFVAITLRLGWARYALIVWLVVAMLGFGLMVLMMNSRSVKVLTEPTNAAVIGLGLCALALVPLGVSRSLRRYLAPRTASGA